MIQGKEGPFMKATRKALSLLLAVMMAASVMAVAVVPASAAKVGDIIQFGNYPQTEVRGTAALKKAADAATWESYGYYSGTGKQDGKMTASDYMKYADFVYGGVKYRAVKFTKYRPYGTDEIPDSAYSYQDDNGYFKNSTYYFKYEPLEWRVLDPSAGLVLCETVIDSQAYQNVVRYDDDKYEYYIGRTNTLANNYPESSIRSWLNDDFYNTAFNSAQKNKLITTKVDNSSYSSDYPGLKALTTYDPIFLLSYSEAQNSSYGLSSESSRKAISSDYAKCQGVRQDSSGFSEWWLRSAREASPAVCLVYYDGKIGSNIFGFVHNTSTGVRPACKLTDLTSDASQLIYTVTATADPAEGGTVTGSGSYTEGQTATLTATANSGYIFSGWYRGSFKVSKNISYSFTVTGNLTYTAKFSKLSKSYTVTATADPAEGGTVTGGGRYTEEKTAILNATPNSGYHFSGWYKDGAKVSSSKIYTFTVTDSVTLTAKFSQLTMGYTVTATADPTEGGTVTGGGSYSDGKTATVNATANSGWHFIGWYKGSTKVSSDASYTFTVTENVTLTAKFEKDAPGTQTRYISFSANGGSGTMNSVEVTGEYQVPDCAFTPPEGKAFDCWKIYGGGKTYQPGDILDVYNEYIALEAQWKEAPRTVSFDANGGTGTMATVTFTGSYTVPDCSFIPPAGKAFDCWKVYGGSQTYQPGDVLDAPGSHIALEAQWKTGTRMISFTANGGSGSMESVTVTGEYHVPACSFTPPEGKVFDCWKHYGGSKTYQPGDILDAPGSHIGLEAQWKEASLTVSFDANGGAGTMSPVPFTDPYTIPACAFTPPEGKVFDCWKISGGDKTWQPGETLDPFGTSVTLQAVWKDAQPEQPPETVKLGDVDFDGHITSADARLALRRSVGLEDYPEGSPAFLACDVDCDGKATSADARLILRASVGLEDPDAWGQT